jgi:multidrug efflux pump subunit AcrB
LVLSFTLVPVLFCYHMRSHVTHQGAHAHGTSAPAQVSRPRRNPFSLAHRYFESGFERFREVYRNVLGWTVDRPWVSVVFGVFLVASLLLFPLLGMDFFPQIDAGQMRLHVRAPPATRIEETQRYFAGAEAAIRELVGEEQIDVILDNIGLPYSSTNTALSDSATVSEGEPQPHR